MTFPEKQTSATRLTIVLFIKVLQTIIIPFVFTEHSGNY